MSGIAGVFNLDGQPVEQVTVQKMMALLAHRGPDENGIWTDGPVALGHCQLRTTPEAVDEHQPISLDDGNYVITCDGRIDNRNELIHALSSDHSVNSQTPDAELILRAYIAWGTDCVSRLVGDFAFAIWDKRLRRLFCARDPIGVRLFHYYFDGQRFLFGTEIKALFADPDVPRSLNEEKMALHLSLGDGDAEQTFYEGVYRLPGGYRFLVTPEGVRKEVYWAPDVTDQIKYSNPIEYVEQFSDLFRQAVKSQMRSTGPIGVMLSGGMDSTSVLCTGEVLRREGTGTLPELRYFSAVFPGLKSVDESAYIQEIVDKYDTPGQQILADGMWGMKPASEPRIPRDEPYIAPYEAWQRLIYEKAAHSGVRVMFMGLGGDEGLSVGRKYLSDLLVRLRFGDVRRELPYLSRSAKLDTLVGALELLAPRWTKTLWAGIAGSDVPPWLDAGMVRKLGLKELLAQAEDSSRYRSHYKNQLYRITQHRGRLPWNLWTETTGAEFNLEPRYPFYDRRLFEFMLKIPPREKFQYGFTKLVLRRAMDGVLTERVRGRRTKTNFGPLFDAGAGDQEVRRLQALLNGSMLSRLGFVDEERLREALNRYARAGSRPDEKLRSALWVAFSMEEWLQTTFTGNGGRNREKSTLPPVVATTDL